MDVPVTRVIPAVLGGMVVCGITSTAFVASGGRAAGLWPVGLAVGALLLLDARRHVPVLVAVIGVLSVAVLWITGVPPRIGLGYGVGVVVEVSLVWWLLTKGRGGRPQLRTPHQLVVFLAAVGLGAAAGAVVSAIGSAVTGGVDPFVVVVATFTAHASSYLAVLPFFCHLPPHRGFASPPERAAQWLLTLGVAPLLFLPRDFPSLVFAIVPLLGWGALRLRPREVLAQMVLVFSFAGSLVPAGTGPFAMVPRSLGLPVDARGIVLAGFMLVCSLSILPLVVAVGQQIQHAHELGRERDKLGMVVDGATGVAIIGIDANGTINLFNPGAERLLGYSTTEMIGRSTQGLQTREAVSAKAHELGVPDDPVAVATALSAPEHAGTQLGFLRKDGVERQHSMTLTRMLDQHGELAGWVSISEDVTEQLRTEAALQEAVAAEQEALTRLEQVDSVKDTFVSSVSHELRTPITSIVGYLELLEEGAFGALTPPQVDAVHRVASNSDRLLDLIDDLLTLSRLHQDGIALTPRAFDLRTVVECGWLVVAPAWRVRQLVVDLDLPDEPVPFVGDRDMVERVVVNLLGNAVKFTPDGGAVRVSLTVEHGEALVVVEDTGIGIPLQEQGLLFTRFFRSSNAQKRAIPGSGLGLSITRAIVEKHGGSIRVVSEPEQGSRFQVRMPIVA